MPFQIKHTAMKQTQKKTGESSVRTHPLDFHLHNAFCKNIIYCDRNEKKMICLAQPMDANQESNIAQSVIVTWTTGTRNTGFTFTYKQNPEIHGIQGSTTTLRWIFPHILLFDEENQFILFKFFSLMALFC